MERDMDGSSSICDCTAHAPTISPHAAATAPHAAMHPAPPVATADKAQVVFATPMVATQIPRGTTFAPPYESRHFLNLFQSEDGSQPAACCNEEEGRNKTGNSPWRLASPLDGLSLKI